MYAVMLRSQGRLLTLNVTTQYMLHIRNNAELSIRNLLKEVAKTHGTELWALDHMDDGELCGQLRCPSLLLTSVVPPAGSPIELRITIDPEQGSAIFDFEGTGPEVQGNHNCPKSVSSSAIIYCLRAMVSTDIPLNQGCLEPIEIRIPEGSMLSPSSTAAVVGGNVLTSQRITDVVLKAFKAVAAGQGDCNNLTFGMSNFGYYETIAGGSGAGPSWHGTSGVQ